MDKTDINAISMFKTDKNSVANNNTNLTFKVIKLVFIKVIISLIILYSTHLLGKYLKEKVNEWLTSQNKSDSNNVKLSHMIISLSVYWTLMLLVVFLILRIFGFEIATLIAIIGTIGFAIGLAIQGVLSDFASGILLSIDNSFNIGEVIEINDKIGIVKEFSLVKTTIEEIDTKAIIYIPNRIISSAVYINHTRPNIRLMHFNILVSNDSKDFQKIIDIIQNVASLEPYIVHSIPLDVNVTNMSGMGTNIKVKLPIKSKSFPWKVAPFMTKLRQALAKNDVKLMDIVYNIKHDVY
jgi:small conductance mechanosensitive channel